MLTRLNALVLSFLTALLLLTIIGSASADGMWGVAASQDQSSITVTGPEGPHTPPKSLFPLYAGDTLTETLVASPTGGGTNSSGQECTLDSVSYSYKNVVITYSPDGVQPFTTGTGSASIAGGNPATLTASFPSPGYYLITYTVHMDYTSKTCGDGSAETTGNLSFAVQAGDFDFILNPASIIIASGGSVSILADPLFSYNGFNKSVTFSHIGRDSLPGLTVSGSGTPPPNGQTTVPLTVSVDKSAPFSMINTPTIVFVRGASQFGSVYLSHDHPLSVLVNFVWITSPLDDSKQKIGSSIVPQPNPRNADGSITTDSVLSYTTDSYGVPLSDPWRATTTLVGKNTAGLDLSNRA